MFLILKNQVCVYALENEPIQTEAGIDCRTFIIGDLTLDEVDVVYTETDLPEDFVGRKYLFIENAFVDNPEYRAPIK